MRPPKDEIEDACARWGFAGAAEEYEVDEPTIIAWLRDANTSVAPGPKEATGRRGRKRLYDHDAIAARLGEGVPRRKVAEEFGCSTTAVSYIATKMGIPVKSLTRRRRYDWAEIRRLHATGLTQPEVARKIGCDPSTVYRVLNHKSTRWIEGAS